MMIAQHSFTLSTWRLAHNEDGLNFFFLSVSFLFFQDTRDEFANSN